jgi:hypothetical protein
VHVNADGERRRCSRCRCRACRWAPVIEDAHRHTEEAERRDLHDALHARWDADDVECAVPVHVVDDELAAHPPETHQTRLTIFRAANAATGAPGCVPFARVCANR